MVESYARKLFSFFLFFFIKKKSGARSKKGWQTLRVAFFYLLVVQLLLRPDVITLCRVFIRHALNDVQVRNSHLFDT